jgi:hypothetical protein
MRRAYGGAGLILSISMPDKLKVLYKFSVKIQRKFAFGNAICLQSRRTSERRDFPRSLEKQKAESPAAMRCLKRFGSLHIWRIFHFDCCSDLR